MTAGSLPTVTILLDDGTGTFPYDISTFARMAEGLTGARGRQDELSTVTAPQPTLVLDNADGRFSFGSTLIASPSPILIDQKVRAKLTANGVTVNRYTGTLIADNVSFPGGGDEFAIATVTLADVQAQADRRTLRSVIEEEVMLDSPSAYYTLGEPAGSLSAADSSGNQQPVLTMAGTGAAVVFGTATGPSTDGLTAATFANRQYLSTGQALGSVGSTPNGWVCAFSTTALGARAGLIGDPAGTMILGIDATGHLIVDSNVPTVSSGIVTDGLVHVVEMTHSGTTVSIYLDGTLVGTGTDSIILFPMVVGKGFTGSISHLAHFVPNCSTTRITAHAQAMLTGFAGESGTAAITRIAGWAGIPVGTLDASLTNIPFVDVTGKTAMAAIQEIADAEFGLVFFDGSGNLTFHNRNRAVGKTAPDITIDANQLDPGTQFFYDSAGILNYVTVTATGTQVAQVARNLVSELGAAGSPKHGRYPDSKTYRVSSDAEALDRGNWLTSQHGQPAPRAGSLVVDLLTMTAAQQAAWLVVEPNTWVRVTGLPAQTPGGTTADLIVQGWGEVLNAPPSGGATWTLALNTASRPAFYQGWILDDTTYSVLDSTTKLYL